MPCDTSNHRGNLATTPEMGTRRYDAESRLQMSAGTYGTSSVVYDGNGRRVVATHGGTDTVYVYDAMGHLVAEYGSTPLVTGTAGAVVERHDCAIWGRDTGARLRSGGGSPRA